MAPSDGSRDEPDLGQMDLPELRDVCLERRGSFRSTGEPFGYEVRLLAPPDVPALTDLHEEIIASLPNPLLLYRRDTAFFDACVARGCVAGAWHGHRLVAYAALFVPGLHRVNYGRDLGLEEDELPAVGHLAGSAVAVPYRGNHLQQELVALRNAYAMKKGYHHMCGEVVPTNLISIGNHLAKGFYLRGHRIDDFGDRCFILHADLRREPRRRPGDEHVEAQALDMERYVELVDEGRWGFDLDRREGRYYIRFGHFD